MDELCGKCFCIITLDTFIIIIFFFNRNQTDIPIISFLSSCVRGSATGQWNEAVRVHNSTQPQELAELCGLALACCSAGLIAESFQGEDRGGVMCALCPRARVSVAKQLLLLLLLRVAYERALALASAEREKSYISTALALLLHRQGDVDSAKTLLFKW